VESYYMPSFPQNCGFKGNQKMISGLPMNEI